MITSVDVLFTSWATEKLQQLLRLDIATTLHLSTKSRASIESLVNLLGDMTSEHQSTNSSEYHNANTMVLTCIDHWDIQRSMTQVRDIQWSFWLCWWPLIAWCLEISGEVPQSSAGMAIVSQLRQCPTLAWPGIVLYHSFGPYPEVLTPYVGNYSPHIWWTIVIVTMLLLFRIFDPVNLLFGA